jgi:type II secretory pathway predicted ATPase ExeA
VTSLGQLWDSCAPLWPVLVIEEAQNLMAPALEELRLLACARADTQPPFSLLLVGDEDLLPRLQLGINRALLSRLGFSLALSPWPMEALRDYLHARCKEVGIQTSPLEPAAETLLLQSAAGLPRRLNGLLQRALESAALAKRRSVADADVQAALDTMPWVGQPDSR